MSARGGEGARYALAPHCSLKRLETPALYDIRADALYELDEEALRFLASSPPLADADAAPNAAELADADIVRVCCSDCPFYKEGEDEELECGAFRLLRHLLRRKVVTVQAILDAVRDGDGR